MFMVQVAWAAIGLLAVAVFGMFGMFFYLSSKIDSLASRLEARIDALGARLDARIDSLSGQLQAHIERHPS
jgi:hypothetical protein